MYSHGGVRVEVDPQIPNGVGGKNPISTDPYWMVGNLELIFHSFTLIPHFSIFCIVVSLCPFYVRGTESIRGAVR